ncbi:DgyrCDS11287 [Dimorphilus gyrociliatus]|uniref:DgyrCDS11287 n=1 Tax=Dimorphilus gyrociliatus TaxID=2664684 RepID=A0A7I8W3V8_9ANNE|nr:DgyrCDS11287 [Dimorphilus gyrociliatus]
MAANRQKIFSFSSLPIILLITCSASLLERSAGQGLAIDDLLALIDEDMIEQFFGQLENSDMNVDEFLYKMRDLMKNLRNVTGSDILQLIQSELNQENMEDISKIVVRNILTTELQCNYDLKSDADNRRLAERCEQELLTLYQSNETWAWSMLDSNGKGSFSSMLAQGEWLGEYDQCKSVSGRISANRTHTELEYFNGHYLKITVRGFLGLEQSLDRIKLGFCATPSCKKFFERKKKFIIRDDSCKYELARGFVEVEKDQPPLIKDVSAIFGIFFFSSFTVLVIFGTVADYIVENHCDEARKAKIIECTTYKVICAFSAYTNLSKLLDARHSQNSFTAIHGIRAISISWVVLGHSYLLWIDRAGNRMEFLKLPQSLAFQAILNANLSVDTFFVISGFLTTYLFIKELKKRGKKFINIKTILLFFLHRIWRLTPFLAATIIFYSTILPRLRTGPIEMSYRRKAGNGLGDFGLCKTYWWRNILYINNLFKASESCLGHTWYLCVDMQLYIFLGIGLFIYAFKPMITIVYLFVLFAVHFIANPLLLGSIIDNDGQISFKKQRVIHESIYVKPYTRVGPYIIGVFLAYVMHMKKHKRISSIFILLGWIFFSSCAIILLYAKWTDASKHFTPWTLAERKAYETLNRPVWGLCIAWVIWACHENYGGFINQILSSIYFIPLSRLSYGIYLTHWTVITYVYMTARYKRFFSHANVFYDFVSNMTLTIILSTLFSLTFEFPFVKLEKILLAPVRSSKKKSNDEDYNKSLSETDNNTKANLLKEGAVIIGKEVP